MNTYTFDQFTREGDGDMSQDASALGITADELPAQLEVLAIGTYTLREANEEVFVYQGPRRYRLTIFNQ